MSDRFRQAARNFWNRAEQQQWTVGTLGRLNSDGTFTFSVPGRPTFVYVTIRQANGAQTVVPARNDASLPHQPRLGVRMRLEYGVYVIDRQTIRGDIANAPSPPTYGVAPHATSHKHGGSDEIASATAGANLIPKAEADGKLAPEWFDYADIVESVQDSVGAMLAAGDQIAITYDDVSGTVTIDYTGSVISSTDDVAEGATNLYFTNERAQDAVGTILTDSATVNFSYDDTLNLITAETIAAGIIAQINSGLDHGTLAGLGDDDHTQYVKKAGDTMTGALEIGRSSAGMSLNFTGSYSITEGSNTFYSGMFRGSADTNLVFTIIREAAGAALMGAGVNGDSFRRFLIQADGGLLWGPGNATRDTNLYREAADTLATDDDFKVYGSLMVQAGSATNDAAVGGILYKAYTSIGNIGGGEDDLHVYAMPADTLDVNGKSIWFEGMVEFANTGNSKTFKLYFFSTVLLSITSTLRNKIFVRGRVIRVTNTTQRAMVQYTANDGTAFADYLTPAATLSSLVNIKGTGLSGGSANNDVVMHSLVIGWDNVNT